MIPLSVPIFNGNEWNYLKQCLDTGWVSSSGTIVNEFEKSVAKYTGSEYAIACMNGTSGLHLALIVSGVQPLDYVIVPNLTFVATINAIKYCNADPILVDVYDDSWQMDLDLLEDFLGSFTVINNNNDLILKKDGRRISAILPVHALGNVGNMDRLLFIAHRFNLSVIEDATEALGSKSKNKHAGTFSKAGVFSFNGNKIITTGGGGMIISNDGVIAKKARHLSTQAKSESEEYTHDEIGYNYRMTNLQAALGVAQMEQLNFIIERKSHINRIYRNHLFRIPKIKFQTVGDNVIPNYWLFTARLPKVRQLIPYLRDHQIESRPLWKPMNQLPMFKTSMYIHRDDIADKLYKSCISLPSSPGLSEREQTKVIKVVKDFYKIN